MVSESSVLLSGWFLVALGALAVSPVVALIGFELRRTRHRRHGDRVMRAWWAAGVRVLALVVALALGVLTVADAINREYQYIPTFDALAGNVSSDLVAHPVVSRSGASLLPKAPSRGVVEAWSVPGPAAHVAGHPLYVYLPPAYFDRSHPFERFPVLYMLHGSPGVAVDWIRGGHLDVAMDTLLAERRILPFIVVMPDFNGGYGRDTECQDIPGGPHMQTYLTVDVVRWVDTHLRTETDRLARAIGGLSTGGYCAANLALRYPDEFSAFISHSGNMHPISSDYSGRLFSSAVERRANTPTDYLPYVRIVHPLGAYLDTGRRDSYAFRDTMHTTAMLRERGVPVTLRVLPGSDHNFATWGADLYTSLPWVSAWFVSHGAWGLTGPPGADVTNVATAR